MKTMMQHALPVFLVTVLTALTACQGPVHVQQPSPTFFLPSSSPSPSAAPTTIPTVASRPTSLPSPTIPVEPLQAPPPESNSPALRFVFPTPGPAPKSAWRPPLYDVPWALTPNDHFYFARPIAADEVNWPLANYRYGATWPGKEDVIHTGVDIDAPEGTPVLAAAGGKVVWVGYGLSSGSTDPNDPYGLAVMLKHDFGYQGDRLESVYAHLSEIDVVYGQEVVTGEQIGLVGNTGMTTGPHLHFEIRVEYSNYYYTTRNPELWLVPPQGWGLLVGHIMENDWTPLYKQDVYVKSVSNGDTWLVRTYANSPALHRDDFYNENLVLSDLPAGDYQVALSYHGTTFAQVVTIHPGMVSYLSFTVSSKFSTALPPTPVVDFLVSPTPTKRP
jgi:murein DD-endopeptidase MepM/ murein hydrolase activator NlpD